MKGFIKITATNNKIVRFNVNAISFYELVENDSKERPLSRIYLIGTNDSIQVIGDPQMIDNLIEDATKTQSKTPWER